MKVAIPSHRRPELVLTKAIKMLETNGFKHNDIDIFVSDREDADRYYYLTEYGCKVIYEKDLKNLQEKYNFMYSFYGINEKILFVEDDIESLVKKDGNRTEVFKGLKGLAEDAFNRCIKLDCILWGINPTDNGFYMKNSITKDMKIILGYVFGFINTKKTLMDCKISQKHDYERTVLSYILKGSTIRYNYIGQKSKSFTNKGGLQSQHKEGQRVKEELVANAYLLKRFPHIIRRQKRINKIFNEATELRLLKPKGDIDLLQYQQHIDSKI
jgi:hypothetical protein